MKEKISKHLYKHKPKIKNCLLPTHILFVGNSYLYYGDGIHNHVKRMARSAGLFDKEDAVFMSITISGGGLLEHSIDSYLEPGKLHFENPFQSEVFKRIVDSVGMINVFPYSRKQFLNT